MGLRKFLHDFIGYRGSQKELHAMLCVIEAHVWEHPEEWSVTSSKKERLGRGLGQAVVNREKGILLWEDDLFGDSKVAIKDTRISNWRFILITDAWIARIDRLIRWHHEYGVIITREKAREATQRERKAQIIGSHYIVSRFKDQSEYGY